MEDKYKKYKNIYDDTPGVLQVGWEWVRWLEKLENQIKPQTYVEIGTEYGGSLATINKTLPLCRLIGIDLKPAHEANSIPFNPSNKYEHHYEFIKGDSHNIETWKKLMIALKGERADVLFIDGAHLFDDVYQDWKDYAPLAKVVALHDISWSEYSRVAGFNVHFLWEYLKTQYRSEELLCPEPERINEDNKIDIWGGIGILYLEDKIGRHPLPMDIRGGESL